MKLTPFNFLILLSLASTSAFSQHIKNPPDNSAGYFSTQDQTLKASGLDKYESEQNWKILKQISENYDALKSSIGADFSGSWVEYDSNNNAYQVVAVTRPVAIKKSLETSGGSKIVIVKHSLQQLETLRKQLIDLYSNKMQGSNALLYSIAIDIRNNKILAITNANRMEELHRAFIADNINMDSIVIEQQEGPINLYRNLYGGQKILSSAPNNNATYPCSAGFNAFAGIYPLIITAGHCAQFNERQTVYFDDAPIMSDPSFRLKSDLIGTYLTKQFNPNDRKDISVFANANFVHYQPPEYLRRAGTTGFVRSPLNVYSIVGSTICSHGGRSGWRCGTLTIPSSSQLVGDVYGSNFYVEYAETNACGGPGDSGGPVVTPAGNAIGVFAGGINAPNGNCSSFGGVEARRSVIQPLLQFLTENPSITIRAI